MSYDELVEGFQEFYKDYLAGTDDHHFQDLIEHGQHPETLFIACSDSRIDPAIITHSEPGEFFAIRNVAALVPPYNSGGTLRGTSSAIEYAVRCLGVKHIVILGHANCGGAKALATNNYQASDYHSFEFLQHWLDIGKVAKDVIYNPSNTCDEETNIRALEQSLILTSLNNLLSFPWIKSKFDTREIQIHGWYFDMSHAALLEYDSDTGVFEDIKRLNKGAERVYNAPSLERFLDTYKKTCSCSCSS